MKVTITITDNPNNTCDVEAHFDPPVKREEIAKTNAGRTTLAFLDHMKTQAKSVEATAIITRSGK